MNLRKILISEHNKKDFKTKGFFHCFQTDPDGESVAVVELEDGTVAIVYSWDIKFDKKNITELTKEKRIELYDLIYPKSLDLDDDIKANDMTDHLKDKEYLVLAWSDIKKISDWMRIN
ncbi:MAG: hypothetical protein GY775_19245 [Candidatus Scalindua sp.]|nr:hypothetical protein [Candidatus Scalindua sp.]